MATIKIQSQANWSTEMAHPKANLWYKWLAFADSQADSKTLWFMVSLIAQGVLCLPLPAVLIYYYNAPTLILTITLGLFFANIIAGMGGSSIRTILGLFAISVIIQVIMIAIFII